MEGPPENGRGREPVQALRAGVPVRHTAVEVERDDGVRDVREHVRLEVDLGLRFLSRRDVTDGRHARLGAVAVGNGPALDLGPEARPIAAQDLGLVRLGPAFTDHRPDAGLRLGRDDRERVDADDLVHGLVPDEVRELLVGVEDAAAAREGDALERGLAEDRRAALALGERSLGLLLRRRVLGDVAEPRRRARTHVRGGDERDRRRHVERRAVGGGAVVGERYRGAGLQGLGVGHDPGEPGVGPSSAPVRSRMASGVVP